jgi:hypothetical protein
MKPMLRYQTTGQLWLMVGSIVGGLLMSYRPEVRMEDRQGFSQFAALENIQVRAKSARAAMRAAEREIAWLETLEAERAAQIARGEW